ncbi:MAG: low-complexity protein [Gammaproteobacteria bacterium]|nr:low-complexity protein [Gammaproteobacteria bacterium]MCY4342253.1 low-complexity protein [Gammaproteobacteria bacterium]
MPNDKIKPVALAVGAAFAASMAMTTLANTEGELFAAEELEPRYDLLADAHGDEGSCGEGSCGEKDDEEGSCGEGSCGDKDDEEGSCGEGSCGDDE